MDPLWLGLAALASSTLTGVFGVGGGVLLIVLMAQFVPPAVLIPLHALVMLYSNTQRTYIQRSHVHWAYVWPFLAGSILGIALMSAWATQLPAQYGQIALAVFVLVSTWRAEWLRLKDWPPAFSGTLTSMMTLFLGATGPLVMSVLPKQQWSKHQIVGTHGMVMTVQHGLKAVAFLILGFSLGDWWIALVAMCVGASLGNVLGAHWLGRLPEARFVWWVNALLTLLALRLLVQALW